MSPSLGPRRVAISEVATNPFNPRDDDDADLGDLVRTMKSVGQLQPVMVVDSTSFLRVYPEASDHVGQSKWVTLGGNRRVTAARDAGLRRITIHVVVCRTQDDMERAILIENAQRKDLPPLKEAEILRGMMTRGNRSTRSVADMIGKSHAYVQQRVDLLKLIPELKEVLAAGVLSVKAARTLATKPAAEQWETLERSYPEFAARYPRPKSRPEPGSEGSDTSAPVSNQATDELSRRRPVNRVSTAASPDPALRPIILEVERALAALRDHASGDARAASRRHLTTALDLLGHPTTPGE